MTRSFAPSLNVFCTSLSAGDLSTVAHLSPWEVAANGWRPGTRTTYQKGEGSSRKRSRWGTERPLGSKVATVGLREATRSVSQPRAGQLQGSRRGCLSSRFFNVPPRLGGRGGLPAGRLRGGRTPEPKAHPEDAEPVGGKLPVLGSRAAPACVLCAALSLAQ